MTTRAGIPGGNAPPTPRLDDPRAAQVARDHARRLDELAKLPMAGTEQILGISLPDATATMVQHHLGRAPSIVLISAVRGPATPGLVEELRTNTALDRRSYIELKATGMGATVVVDVLVFP